MSNSIIEIIINFFGLLIVFMVLPKISSFFTIGLEQALGMAVGITLLDTIVYVIKKVRKNKKS